MRPTFYLAIRTAFELVKVVKLIKIYLELTGVRAPTLLLKIIILLTSILGLGFPLL